jgi:hypothetical protein
MRRRRSPLTRVCLGGCGERVGPRADFCARCRKRRARRLAAGLPADALPEGARRGRLRIGQLTAGEARLRAELEQALELVRGESYREGFDAGVRAATERALPVIRRLRRELGERRASEPSRGA